MLSLLSAVTSTTVIDTLLSPIGLVVIGACAALVAGSQVLNQLSDIKTAKEKAKESMMNRIAAQKSDLNGRAALVHNKNTKARVVSPKPQTNSNYAFYYSDINSNRKMTNAQAILNPRAGGYCQPDFIWVAPEKPVQLNSSTTSAARPKPSAPRRSKVEQLTEELQTADRNRHALTQYKKGTASWQAVKKANTFSAATNIKASP